MKTYKELEEKFDKDIEKLQKNCKHKDISKWIDQWWAIGHSTGWQVKVCNICNKVVERKRVEIVGSK